MVSLSRESIGAAALELVQQAGLSSLSMRGVATAVGVQPGALYWHVESKQELLALLAWHILAAEPFSDGQGTARSAATLASDLRASLLAVRDGAEIVSFARALHPDYPIPLQPVTDALLRSPRRTAETPGRADHEDSAGESRPVPLETVWAAGALVHFVLGFVAEEQNRAELARVAAATSPAAERTSSGDASSSNTPSAKPASGKVDAAYEAERVGANGRAADPAAFTYGVSAILRGIGVPPDELPS